VMGNSVKQWLKTYNISGKRRAAQKAVDAHHQARAKARGLHSIRGVVMEDDDDEEEDTVSDDKM